MPWRHNRLLKKTETGCCRCRQQQQQQQQLSNNNKDVINSLRDLYDAAGSFIILINNLNRERRIFIASSCRTEKRSDNSFLCCKSHANDAVSSGGFELVGLDQERLHYYVGSTGQYFRNPWASLGGGGSFVRNATKCVLINTIPILITAVHKHFVYWLLDSNKCFHGFSTVVIQRICRKPCYLVSKQKLFCTLFIVPLHRCLSARFTTRPITQL